MFLGREEGLLLVREETEAAPEETEVYEGTRGKPVSG